MIMSVHRLGFIHRPSGEFDLTQMFANGEAGFLYTPWDLTTLAQNSDGTGSVSVGDPVGFIADQSGNGVDATQATGTARPILRQDAGGHHYLEFDGSDDGMVMNGTWAVDDPLHVFVSGLATGGAENDGFWTGNVGGSQREQRAVGIRDLSTLKVDVRSEAVYVGGVDLSTSSIVEGRFSDPASDEIAAAVDNNALKNEVHSVDNTQTDSVLGRGLTDSGLPCHIYGVLVVDRFATEQERTGIAQELSKHAPVTI